MHEVSAAQRYYQARSRFLYRVAQTERDPDLRVALLLQSERVGMKALRLDLKRKQDTLQTLGVPLRV